MATTFSSAVPIPSLQPTPILGWRANVVWIFSDPINRLAQLRNQYGDIVALAQDGNLPLISSGKHKTMSLFVYGADYQRHVLHNMRSFGVGPFIGGLHPSEPDELITARRKVLTWLGVGGLMGMNGEQHQQHRRILSPALHKQRLREYNQLIIDRTDRMLAEWRSRQIVDLHPELMKLTMLIAGDVLFGLDFEQDQDHLGDLIQSWIKLTGNPAVQFLQKDWVGLPYRKYLNVSHQLDQKTREIVTKKRVAPEQGVDALSILLKATAENPGIMSEEDIVGHANLLYVAGHETSSNQLAWTLFLLTQHPKIASQLFSEIEDLLQGQAPTHEQVDQLPLLDRVVKESMRILPATPTIFRVVKEACELGPYQLEAGYELLLSVYHTHHDKTLFPQPNQFNPDRWLNRSASAAEGFMPFGSGKKTCMGSELATYQIKLIIIRIMQQFRLSMPKRSHVNVGYGITLSPAGGLNVALSPQDRQFEKSVAEIKGSINDSVDLAIRP